MNCLSRWFSQTWQDAKFGLRVLGRAPGFTAVAILSLALGIGANTAVFTLVNAVLLRMLPVEHPEALVSVLPRFRGGPLDFSYPMARDLVRQQNVLSGAAFAGSTGIARARFGASIVEGVQFFTVSREYFSVLGVHPVAGRFFTREDDSNPGSARVRELAAVIGFGFWERNFAKDPSVLGRRFELDRIPCRVVGIAPRGFFGHETGFAIDVWLPLVPFYSRDALESRTRGAFDAMVGRLRPGVSRSQAEANLTTVFRSLLREEPGLGGPGIRPGSSAADYRIRLEPAATGMGHLQREYRTPLLIVLAAVGLLLLIACANVANLLLARGASRSKEMSIRLALGATRRRIAAQLLTESLLLACGGAVVGVLFAIWGTRALRSFVEFGGWYSTALDVSPDLTVLVFLTGVTLASAVLFGFVPAWRQTAPGACSRQRLSRSLVIVQVALSVVLVNGAVLLGRSLRNLHSTNLGFVSQNLLAVFFNSEGRYSSHREYLNLAQQVQERMESLPAVRSVAISWLEPFYNYVPSISIEIQGYTPASGEKIAADYNIVGSGYFSTLGIRLLQGREFTAADREGAPLAAVVNQTFARKYFPDRPALGATFTISREGYENQPFHIVGIVRNSKRRSVREVPAPGIYLCLNQLDRAPNWVSLRTAANPEGLVSLAREAMREVSGDLVILKVETLENQVDETLRSEHLLAQLISFFGGAALLLVSIGLYGVLAFAVERRTKEIGIRMALGARPGQILAAIFRDTLALMAAGSLLGIAGVLLATPLLAKFLYGIAPRDPGTIAAGLLVLMVVAFLAAWIPARRASQVDPGAVLRAG